MSDKPTTAAIEGWYTMDNDQPHLIGTSCNSCGTYYFPKLSSFCKNPDCEGEEFTEVQLSRTGKIWSYTDSQYKPPEPYIAADPYVPYTVAAVQLEKEQMIVLGQVVAGVTVDQLKVGDDVELVLETLYEDDEANKVIWKWKPVA
ncbi:MAG: OB-fold domain-containing protein [Pseudomonadales bacterium]|nr:OB-fold domain-containing protein [Pseudomonadales bacterium]